MDTILPDYEKVIQLEEKTLKFLHNVLSKREIFCHVEGQVKKHWSKSSQNCFFFSTYWDVVYRSNKCHLCLGAEVNKRYRKKQVANSTYFICLVESTDEKKTILRKFHFDYISTNSYRRQVHPMFHLQYSGRFTPSMTELGISEEHMEHLLPNVDGPRIFFRPMTIALLMNIAFYEFPGGQIDEIKKSGEWQNIVRENEKIILKPFYECCAQLAGKDKSIFFDKVYV